MMSRILLKKFLDQEELDRKAMDHRTEEKREKVS
jgi:hypothetical protein